MGVKKSVKRLEKLVSSNETKIDVLKENIINILVDIKKLDKQLRSVWLDWNKLDDKINKLKKVSKQ